MLSVLIPVYNYDVRRLTKSLQEQLLIAGVAYEIILGDDASEMRFKMINRELAVLNGVLYSEEESNLGRSKIRNKLARLAKFDNLLFIDCDSQIPDDNYIQSYLGQLPNHEMVYGGTVYQPQLTQSENFVLHWKYGHKREQCPARYRNIEPNRSFHSNNFLISKQLFLSIGFNEDITGYGHEDTLFGYELQKYNIRILHIDNPVIHEGLESNEIFLMKTREGIKNLIRILSMNSAEKKLIKDVTILSFYRNIERMGLRGLIEYFYNRYEHKLRQNLLGSNPNLLVFDFYKLGYLCSIRAQNHK